jgi:CubicO group peptidase (beta-lactamase class C family)
MPSTQSLPFLIGHVDSGFESVRGAFLANFEQGQEVGAAVAVYQHGRPVVDLAAGLRDPSSGAPYDGKTLQPIFSATKGTVALAANMLVDRGQLDLDAPVATCWPEFAQAGKFQVPVRWLLTHQAGELGLDEAITHYQLLSWNYVVDRLARQRPDWRPGSEHGYRTLTYGFLVGEVILAYGSPAGVGVAGRGMAGCMPAVASKTRNEPETLGKRSPAMKSAVMNNSGNGHRFKNFRGNPASWLAQTKLHAQH